MKCPHPVTVLVALALPACGLGGSGDDAVDVDARVPLDAAAPDARSTIACTGGGEASVSFDLGGNAAPLAFVSSWWNNGHDIKSCFDISVVLSTTDQVPFPYEGAEGVLEIWFTTDAALGDNTATLHLYQPDRYLSGTVTLTTLSDTDVAGTIDATDGASSVTGSFSAVRCQSIYDPCI